MFSFFYRRSSLSYRWKISSKLMGVYLINMSYHTTESEVWVKQNSWKSYQVWLLKQWRRHFSTFRWWIAKMGIEFQIKSQDYKRLEWASPLEMIRFMQHLSPHIESMLKPQITLSGPLHSYLYWWYKSRFLKTEGDFEVPLVVQESLDQTQQVQTF